MCEENCNCSPCLFICSATSPRGQRMNYRCRLGQLCNSSTVSGRSDPQETFCSSPLCFFPNDSSHLLPLCLCLISFLLLTCVSVIYNSASQTIWCGGPAVFFQCAKYPVSLPWHRVLLLFLFSGKYPRTGRRWSAYHSLNSTDLGHA